MVLYGLIRDPPPRHTLPIYADGRFQLIEKSYRILYLN